MSVIKPRRIPLPLLHTVQFDEFLIKRSTTYNEVLVWLSRLERLKSDQSARQAGDGMKTFFGTNIAQINVGTSRLLYPQWRHSKQSETKDAYMHRPMDPRESEGGFVTPAKLVFHVHTHGRYMV